MSENMKELQIFANKLRDLAHQHMKLEIRDGKNKVSFAAFVLCKAHKTYEAVLLLACNGYGEDAFMLTRSLFELLITNSYILKDPTDDTLIRYMSHDWVTRKEMYDYIASKPELLKVIQSAGKMDTITEVENKFKAVMKKYKYNNGWSDKTIKGMSADVGREDMYSTVYKLQCTVGHTNARSINEYVHETENGIVFNVGSNWDLAESALVIALDCFFHILGDAGGQFGWNLEPELNNLAQEYAAVMGGVKSD